MTNKPTKSKGKNYLILLTLMFIISEVVFPFLISEKLHETIIKTIVVGWPIVFLFRGYKWSKWVTSFLLVLNSILTILIATELSIASLYTIGIFNVTFAVVIHASKEIQVLFESQSISRSTVKPQPKIESNNQLKFPYLITRYKAALIDGLVLFGLFAMTMILVQDPEARKIAFGVYLLIAIMYEPLMLSFFSATIGHKAVNIKVKSIKNTEKNISIIQGIIRNILKLTLGWMSFLTINFNSEHRAIHDYAGESIVLDA